MSSALNTGLPPPARRWAISFADLALLIACTLMLGWRPATGARTDTDAARQIPAVSAPIAAMFVDGEAMLSARGLAMLGPARRAIADGSPIRITVGAGQTGSSRLDAWELAAARTAMIARTLGTTNVGLGAPAGDARVRIDIAR